MSRPPARRLGVLVVVGSALCASALPVLAQESSEVSVDVAGPASRQLALLDLTGQPLEDLALRSGVPMPFRVDVTDAGLSALTDPTSSFTVNATLNNLYSGGDAAGAFLPSSSVMVGPPVGGGLSALGELLAQPTALLNGTLAPCQVDAETALPELVPLPDLAQPLTDAVCEALGVQGLTLDDLPVQLPLETLTGTLGELPFDLQGALGGAFTEADYVNGIGAADTRGTGGGTARQLLSGLPTVPLGLQTLLDDLQAELGTLLPVSPDGTGALLTAEELVQALVASSDAQASQLGAALTDLTPAEVDTLLAPVTALIDSLGLDDLLDLNAVYRSLPVITAVSTGAPAQGGTFTGTMTVTLVQGPDGEL